MKYFIEQLLSLIFEVLGLGLSGILVVRRFYRR